MKFPIYLDYAATTPVHDLVIDKMMPYFQQKYGNSGSQQHVFGWETEEIVEQSRAIIAHYFQVKSRQVIFTSGATESNNLAIQGYLKGFNTPGHLITCSTEHKAVLEVFKHLESQGWELTYLSVDSDGQISLDELKNSIQVNTHLISIMWVNNETGTIQPIQEICSIAKANQIVFHCDATQALGKVDLHVQDLPDLISFSAHKIYGPKGVGGLVINNDSIQIFPLVFGGNQERGLRSGTLPTQQIVGMSEAFKLIPQMLQKNEFYHHWKNNIFELLTTKYSEKVKINSFNESVPNLLSFSVIDFDWDELFNRLNKIAVSNGSACNAKTKNPSHVLKAMGLNNDLALSTIRLSMGLQTTNEEMEFVIDYLDKQLNQL